MPMPLFYDVEPPPACGCEGCARQRLADSMARDSCGPISTGATRVLVVTAAAGTALGGTAATGTAAPRPAGATGHTTGRAILAAPGAGTAATPLRLTRAQIPHRARTWPAAGVPYSTTGHRKDGYRQDCSGSVSMAWGLGTSAWTAADRTATAAFQRAQGWTGATADGLPGPATWAYPVRPETWRRLFR